MIKNFITLKERNVTININNITYINWGDDFDADIYFNSEEDDSLYIKDQDFVDLKKFFTESTCEEKIDHD